MIYADRYNIILSACQDLRRRRDQLAGPAIAGLVLDEVGMDVPSDVLLSHIVSEALLRRVDRNLLAGKNIYLQAYEVAQIDLFDLLRKALPPLVQGYAIANQHLAHALAELEGAALLDIGVGKGVQLAMLMTTLAAAPGRLRRLRVVALDPSAANLVEAQAVIDAAAFWFSSASLSWALSALACSTSLRPNSFSPASRTKLSKPMKCSLC